MRLAWLLFACSLTGDTSNGASRSTGSSSPPTGTTTAPVAPPTAPATERMRASWVYVTWTGAGAPRTPRTREEARQIATAAHNDLIHGADLPAIAKRLSDDPTGRHGGALGMFAPGTYTLPVEAAIAALAENAVSPVTDLGDGFAIFRREVPDEVRVSWALWGFQGANHSRAGRTEQAALALATDAATAARRGDALPPADQASDAGGDLIGRQQWPPDLDRAIFLLQPGAVSDPVRTPEGWMVLQRAR